MGTKQSLFLSDAMSAREERQKAKPCCFNVTTLKLYHTYTQTHTHVVLTWCVVLEVAVASLCAGGIDAKLGEGGSQVPRAATSAQRWVGWLILIKRCGQRGGEVEAGQVRQ